jgi:hypothetical protein
MGWLKEGILCLPKEEGWIMALMDISQFNALLHSKKNHSELISALSELTNVRDLDVLHNILQPLGGWSGWPL